MAKRGNGLANTHMLGLAASPYAYDHFRRYLTPEEFASAAAHSARVCQAVEEEDHRSGLDPRPGRVYSRDHPKRRPQASVPTEEGAA